MLLTREPVSDFRCRMEYRIVDPKAEGQLVWRSPNAYQGRAEGYSIGLQSDSINTPKHFVFMSYLTKPIAEIGSIQVSPNKWHTLELKAIGKKMSVSFDGAAAYSFEDTRYEIGVLGVHTREPGIEIRKFEYQSIDGESASKPPNGP